MPKAFQKIKPENSLSTKAIAKTLTISKDKVNNIINYLGIIPVMCIERNGNTIKYYSQDCLVGIKEFIKQHPNTKSFFIKEKLSSSDIKEKMINNKKKVMLEKYGVENPSQIPGIQFKKKESFEQRWGESFAEHMHKVSSSDDNIKKRNDTMRERYGDDYRNVIAHKVSLSRDSTKAAESFKKTMIDTYGVENPSQVPDIKKKIMQTKASNREKALSYIRDNLKGVPKADIEKEFDIYDMGIRSIINRFGIEFKHYSGIPYITVDALDLIRDSLIAFKDVTTPTSVQEEEVRAFIKSIYDGEIIYNSRKIIPPKEIDIYLPDIKVGIEFNGNYWHSTICCDDKNYHYNKSISADEGGIRLIHIYEFEWSCPNTRKKIEDLLKITCGRVAKRLFARKCIVRQISNKEAKQFNELNHLQGHRNAQVTYGLFYGDELVQLMSFSKSKYNKNLSGDNDWEIIRSCSQIGCVVTGGLSKLYKYFVRLTHPTSVFSYCDLNKFNGKGYESLGMRLIGTTGPNMWWVMSFTNQDIIPRNPRKNKEYEAQALAKIWGAGSKKYLITY